jgi:ornithine cyclodeaminase/alanine dehydrogenase-like protein (mu-crystallin family)
MPTQLGDALVLTEPEIRQLLTPAACIAAVERAFTAYAQGAAELPGVIHLDIPDAQGEIHIKAGYLHATPWYAVKFASGFPGNPALGLPANGGIVVVFDARTGALAAILLDNGYITDLRTAAAGAVAAKHLARESIGTVGVIGTGAQARYQIQLLAQVHTFHTVKVWGRRHEAAAACVADIAATGVHAIVANTLEEAVTDSDVVITVTASRTPLVRAAWVKPGALVIAVGSDSPDKRELEVDVLALAGRVVADSLPQCRRLGEIHHALDAGVLQESRITELGQITAGQSPGRTSDAEIIVCDLTGVGVQDVAAAAVVMDQVRS